MKKLIGILALTVAFSASAVASSSSMDELKRLIKADNCKIAGGLAKQFLTSAKLGINSHDELANDPERMQQYGMHASIIFLVMGRDVWDNRATYNNAKAYAAGYKICMDLY